MATQVYLKKYFLLVIVIALLFTNCSKKMSAAAAGGTSPHGDSLLNVLYIESSEFQTISNNKIIFQFTLDSSNKFTLIGWGAGGALRHNYNENRTITLKTAFPSKISYGPSTVFSNVMLQKAQIIRRSLRSGKEKYILFYPKYDKSCRTCVSYFTVNSNSINATVHTLSQEITATSSVLNPSPPKRY